MPLRLLDTGEPIEVHPRDNRGRSQSAQSGPESDDEDGENYRGVHTNNLRRNLLPANTRKGNCPQGVLQPAIE